MFNHFLILSIKIIPLILSNLYFQIFINLTFINIIYIFYYILIQVFTKFFDKLFNIFYHFLISYNILKYYLIFCIIL